MEWLFWIGRFPHSVQFNQYWLVFSSEGSVLKPCDTDTENLIQYLYLLISVALAVMSFCCHRIFRLSSVIVTTLFLSVTDRGPSNTQAKWVAAFLPRLLRTEHRWTTTLLIPTDSDQNIYWQPVSALRSQYQAIIQSQPTTHYEE